MLGLGPVDVAVRGGLSVASNATSKDTTYTDNMQRQSCFGHLRMKYLGRWIHRKRSTSLRPGSCLCLETGFETAHIMHRDHLWHIFQLDIGKRVHTWNLTGTALRSLPSQDSCDAWNPDVWAKPFSPTRLLIYRITLSMEACFGKTSFRSIPCLSALYIHIRIHADFWSLLKSWSLEHVWSFLAFILCMRTYLCCSGA